MISKRERKNIISLAKNGVSLNKMCKITGIPKSTIYYHTKNIGNKCGKVDLNKFSEFENGYIVGMFIGDGNFDIRKDDYRYGVVFNLNKKTETDLIMSLLRILENSGGHPYISSYKNLAKVTIISKKLYEYLNHFSVYNEIKKSGKIINKKVGIRNFKNWSRKFKFGFISGLVDSDGYIGPHGNGLRAFIYTSHEKLAKNIFNIAKSIKLDISLRPQLGKNMWYIRIFHKSLRTCKDLKFIKGQ